MQSVDGVSLLTEANYETRVPSNEGDDTPKATLSESEAAAAHTRTLKTSNEVLSLSCSDIQIGERIGAGGFGTVRRGLLRQHTEVALKTITHDEEKDQIVNELMLLSKIRHPNVCLFLGACEWTREGEDCGKIVLVSELLKGDLGSLLRTFSDTVAKDILLQEPVLSTRMDWARQAAVGVAFLHGYSTPVIHCDIKPDNFLYDSSGRIKVCDFGYSRFGVDCRYSGDSLSPRTDKRNPIGTPMYMAPEVWERGSTSVEADVWAFGISLWELACAQLASRAMKLDSRAAVRAATLKGRRPHIPEELPERLRDCIRRCWAQDPSQRPTFTEIVHDLTEIIAECKQLQYSAMVRRKVSGDNEGARLWQEMLPDGGTAVDIWKFAQFFLIRMNVHVADNDPKMRCLLFMLTHNPGAKNKDVVELERWGQMLSWFGPLDAKFLDRIEALLTKPWFHNFSSSQQAEEILGQKDVGYFLARFSGSTFGAFCISYVRRRDDGMKEVVHRVIRRCEETNRLIVNNRSYSSLEELISRDGQLFGLQHACSDSFNTRLFFCAEHNESGGYLTDPSQDPSYDSFDSSQ